MRVCNTVAEIMLAQKHIFRVTSVGSRGPQILKRYSSNLSNEKVNSVSNNDALPPVKIHRVSYEYPPPPKPGSKAPVESSVWRRHLPLMIGVGSLLWAGYAAYYFLGDSKLEEQSILTPDKFSVFKITCKQQLSDDLALIEIAPKFAASSSMLKSGTTMWNGKRLWSIQVKHPLIQIVRNYTPLPLYFMQSERSDELPLLRMIGTSEDEGRMCLLVKQYETGEMSRYIHSLPVGSDIEIRGPFIEHKFPYEPADSQKMRQPMLDIPTRMKPEPELDPFSDIKRSSNIAMFTAGTGISTALQLLLSPHNPPRGIVHVFNSVRDRKDLQLTRFMLFLESVGRAKFHIFVDKEGSHLDLQDVPVASESQSPVAPVGQHKNLNPERFTSAVQQYSQTALINAPLSFGSSVVCGPPGYMAYVAGDPGIDGKKEIGGLLGSKGWSLKNTKRLLDI